MTARESRCPRVGQAVGFALHALEPGEELEFARHLPDCPDCQAALRDADDVAAELGAAVPQLDPPPRLRTAILAAAAQTPQEPAAAPVEPLPARAEPARRSWFTRGRLVAAAAVLVAAAAIGGFAVRTEQLEQARTAQNQAIAELVGTLAPAGTRHAVLATDDGTTVGAVMVAGEQRQVLTVGMPANPAAQNTYVLWGIGDSGTPVALGTFDVTSTEPAMRAVGGADPASFGVYAVSLEPGRTAPAAPSNVMAKGQLA